MTHETGDSPRTRIREASVPEPAEQGMLARSIVRTRVHQPCEDCRATSAFQAWHSQDLTPSFNVGISFGDYGIPPAGKRAVIELVTAEIRVPVGEWARLRMYTSLGSQPSNIDLFLTFQGNVGGEAVYIATHSIRAYSDRLIEFNINRDNATTSGYALICISGYLADA